MGEEIKDVIKKDNNKETIFNYIVFISSLTLSLILFTKILKNNILSITNNILFGILLFILYSVPFYFLYNDKVKNDVKRIFTFNLIIIGLFSMVSILLINKGLDTIGVINTETKEKITYSLIVRKDSTVNTVNDILKEDEIVYVNENDSEINVFQKKIQEKIKENFKYEGKESYLQLVDELINNKINVIILNNSYKQTILEYMPDFYQKIKIINTLNFEREETEISKPKVTYDLDSFNIYVAGKDGYGGFEEIARSDVNVIMSVNPKTEKILVTTIPRDSYVKIAGKGKNKYDKLTHAGIYGIDSSIKTLEKFLDTEINYYVKLNFNSFINVIDNIGGIEVYNPETYKRGKTIYEKGKLQLNGSEALAFARERKQYSEGDFERGRNHTRIIEAVIEKITKNSSELNYKQLMSMIGKSIKTNMPTDKIIELFNFQMDNKPSWKITKRDIKGKGSMSLPSYAMPGYKLWMFVPDKKNVKELKKEIKDFLQEEKVNN